MIPTVRDDYVIAAVACEVWAPILTEYGLTDITADVWWAPDRDAFVLELFAWDWTIGRRFESYVELNTVQVMRWRTERSAFLAWLDKQISGAHATILQLWHAHGGHHQGARGLVGDPYWEDR